MSSTSETGHIKNVSLFEDLITYCQAYGTNYNPSNTALSIAQLQATYASAQSVLNDFKTQKTSFDLAVNERRVAFEDIKPLATRIINALIASGAPKLTIDDAKGVNKKLQGTSSKKSTTEMNDAEKMDTPKSISTSQQSYDRVKDHLANLIQILQQTPQYNPNENDLKVPQLQARLGALEAAKTAWISAQTIYSNAISNRNRILYNPDSGLKVIAQKVKTYVKSIYGSQSPQYKQVSGLKFVNSK
jgi:hypothetical protein